MLFTSSIGTSYRDALEKLLFFNPGQVNALEEIMDAVQVYGTPELFIEKERIRVRVGELADVKSIYALDDDRLTGVLLYLRTNMQSLVVAHISVAGDYSASGPQV